jgi:hypothetical protein
VDIRRIPGCDLDHYLPGVTAAPGTGLPCIPADLARGDVIRPANLWIVPGRMHAFPGLDA